MSLLTNKKNKNLLTLMSLSLSIMFSPNMIKSNQNNKQCLCVMSTDLTQISTGQLTNDCQVRT